MCGTITFLRKKVRLLLQEMLFHVLPSAWTKVMYERASTLLNAEQRKEQVHIGVYHALCNSPRIDETILQNLQ